MHRMRHHVETCEGLELKLLLQNFCDNSDHVERKGQVVSNLERHE
jgi:hypothetical protein